MSITAALPPEILSDIFQYCTDTSRCRPSASNSPLVLGHVCGTWRDVLNSTPTLWTKLSIDLPGTPVYWDDFLDEVLSILDKWLHHASHLTISLEFVETGKFPPNLASRIVHVLVANAHRWKELKLDVSESALFNFMQLVSFELPFLEKLEARSSATYWRSFSAGAHNVYGDMDARVPRLTSLIWNARLVDMVIFSNAWAQLTELSILYEPLFYHFQFSHQLDILTHTRSLVSLSLGLTYIPWMPHESLQAIVLPRLTTLRLRRMDPQASIWEPFSALITPMLKTLEIDSAGHLIWTVDDWHMDQIPSLLGRSDCLLEILRVRHAHFTETEIIDILRCTPLLREFTFIACSEWTCIDGLLEYLSGKSVDITELPLPELESIELGFALDSEMPRAEQLKDLLNSRTGRSAAGAGREGRPESGYPLLRLGVTIDHFDHRLPWYDLASVQEAQKVKALMSDFSACSHVRTEVAIERAYQPKYLHIDERGDENYVYPSLYPA